MKLKIGSLGLFDDYHNSSLILVQLLTYKLGRLGKNCLTLWSPFVSCSKMIQMVLCQPLLKFSTTKVFQWQILFQLIGFKSSHVAYIEKHCYEAVLQYKKQKKKLKTKERMGVVSVLCWFFHRTLSEPFLQTKQLSTESRPIRIWGEPFLYEPLSRLSTGGEKK